MKTLTEAGYRERRSAERVIRMALTVKISSEALAEELVDMPTHHGFWRMVRTYLRLMGFLADVLAAKCEEFNHANVSVKRE